MSETQLETALRLITKRANDIEEFEGKPEIVKGLDIAIAIIKGLQE